MKMEQTKTTTSDFVKLAKKLAGIGTIEKCEGCSCYIDTINEFDAVLQDAGESAPAEARAQIDALSQKHQPTHNCIGCDPCYPVGVSNRLFEISDGKSADVESLEAAGCCDVPTVEAKGKSLPLAPLVNITPIAKSEKTLNENLTDCSGSSCGCDAPTTAAPVAMPKRETSKAAAMSWVVETGDYRLGNPKGAVAVATLASEELYKEFSEKLCDDDCAICGKVFTENIGIEKVVKNIVANPNIRFLILCGQEAKGHQTGACIKALHANGLNERGRIAEAPGKRPWIKTLTAEQISRFQQQIEIVDLIGCEDVATIEAKASELSLRNPGVLGNAPIKSASVPHYIARETVKLKLDRAGFFIVHPKPEADWLMVEHYRNSGEPTCVIEGRDPAKICAEIIERGLVSQLDHAAYLGREIERAKLSMQVNFNFRQDRALGELNGENAPEW
jgi:tetrahydromethanopterin S-methyltransferase subunit A